MSSRSGVRRVIPLTLGWEELPITISIHPSHGADSSVRLREPVPGVLCEVDGGWVLLDAGFNAPLVRDPILYQRFHSHGVNAELPPTDGDPLEWAFERVGIDPRDVVAVGLSHLHNDHAGGVKYFTGKVPIHCQRRELEFGLSDHPRPERNAMFRFDFDDPAIDWRLADGDLEIAPGLTAIATYGHTPGHQSFMVDLDDGGGFVFAFDAADLQRNIDEELSVGCLIDAEPEDSIAAIRRLKAIARERGYRLLPGHDPEVWPAFEAEMGIAPIEEMPARS
jgi:N-acyl homoserine lactone hydrolase